MKKIELNIAGRLYPLNVDNEEEEKKAEVISETIKKDLEQIDKQYSGVKDKQDLLAILAFQYKNESIDKNFISKEDLEKLDDIEKSLDSSLNL